MILKNLNIAIVFALLLCACSEEWDKHYKDSQGGGEKSTKNVWEYLQGCADYSEFVALMKETHADTIFLKDKDQRYTLWIPKNGSLNSLKDLSDPQKGITLENHISLIDYSESGFRKGLSLRSFSGKLLRMHNDPTNVGGFLINSSRIVKTVMTCSNGIIHEIETPLMLQPNLYDYLKESGYNVLNKLLSNYQDSIFDEKHSIPLGTNFEGETVYDSVFIQTNAAFKRCGFIDKDQGFYYTLFLTSDEELTHEMEQYYDNIRILRGVEPVAADTTKLEDWLAYSFIQRGFIENYGEVKMLSNNWNTQYQKIDVASGLEFSNGLAYKVTDLFVPNRFIMMEAKSSIDPAYSVSKDFVKTTVSGLLPEEYTEEIKLVTIAGSTANYLFASMRMKEPVENPNFDYELSWTTSRLDTNKRCVPEMFCPGEYSVKFDFVKTLDASQNFEVWINDVYVNTVDISKYTSVGTLSTASLGYVSIKQENGVAPIKITLKNMDKSWKRAFAPCSVILKPTNNNY